MKIFGELVECLHNVRSGPYGDSVEIFATRLAHTSSLAILSWSEPEDDPMNVGLDAIEEFATNAAETLTEICTLFEKTYKVPVYVDGVPLVKDIKPFKHSVWIKVGDNNNDDD
jgi:hypothetical protein